MYVSGTIRSKLDIECKPEKETKIVHEIVDIIEEYKVEENQTISEDSGSKKLEITQPIEPERIPLRIILTKQHHFAIWLNRPLWIPR
jgi:hypothetical protein